MTTLTIRPSSIYVGNRYFGRNTSSNRKSLLKDAKINNWKVRNYSKVTVRRKPKRRTVGFSNLGGIRLPRMPRF